MNLSNNNNNKEVKLAGPAYPALGRTACLPVGRGPVGPEPNLVQGRRAQRGTGHVPVKDFYFSLFFLDY
jgi:hypothetical protein